MTDCPLKHIDRRTQRLMRFARYARDLHVMPVAGGALDQTPGFLAATAQIESDRAAWRAHFGIT